MLGFTKLENNLIMQKFFRNISSLNWLKSKSKDDDSNLTEYTFIWYKKMETKSGVYYTRPYRTKVKAKSFAEAKEKAIQFALSKMQLVIYEENPSNTNSDDLNKFMRQFDDLNQKMKDFSDNLKL
jgi:hypothetical protein